MRPAETAAPRRVARRTRVLCVAVLAVASSTVVACEAASPIRRPVCPSLAALPSGRALGEVPWQRAGPGWSVAEYSVAGLPGPDKSSVKGVATFYLVSPAGRKYAFYRTAPTPYPQLDLVDWSGDRQRILVDGAVGGECDLLEPISLTTGAVVSRFRLPAGVTTLGYTRPRGTSVLAMGSVRLFRYNLAGRLQRALAPGAVLTGPLVSARGGFVAAGTTNGLEEVSDTGAVMRRIAVPAPVILCGTDRWWTATVVLADCDGRGPFATSRLWLVPLGGGPPTALTPPLRPHGLFQGYVNAWKLASGLYLQADNAHDTLSIVRQLPDGSRHTVTIPGPAGISDSILTSRAGWLLLQSAIGLGGPSSLFWFNPATGSVRFIFRTPPGIYGVAGAIPYGYRNG
jgi:hypothetical protein